jgi:hypothetical protein
MPLITGFSSIGGTFAITGLAVNNLSSFSRLNYDVDPTLAGLTAGSKFVSGVINQNNLSVSLNVKSPQDDLVYSTCSIDLDVFSGFKADLYTKDRSYIGSLFNDYKSTDFNFSNTQILSLINNNTGALSGLVFSGKREYFIDIVSSDIFGNEDIYYFLLNYPTVKLTGIDIRNTNPLTVFPYYDNVSGLRSLNVYTFKNVSLETGSGQNDFYSLTPISTLSFDYSDKKDNFNFTIDPPDFFDSSLETTLPFYLMLAPYDYLYSGQLYVTSGIKTSYYDTSVVPSKIDSITGYISCSQNQYDKNLDAQAIVKWNDIKTSNALSFEAYVYEDGLENANYIFSSTNPQVEGIKRIHHGTGLNVFQSKTGSTYYSGSTPIFQKYGNSGIRWPDHTLFLDNYSSFPLGFYPTGGLFDYITEIRIPSGYLNYPELYFIKAFDTGTNSFILLPSGDQYSGSIYTGSYSGARFISGGRYLEYTYDGTAMSPGDPGANKLQGDAPLGSNSIGKLYLDSSNHLGNDVEFFLSRITGKIKLEKKDNSQSYAIYNYENYNSNAGYFDITVDLFRSSSVGSISVGDRVLLSRYSDTPSTIDYEQGVLFAKRITGNADFILSEFEPKIKFPIKPNKNYEVKVRASYQDGSFSDFSETLRFTSGQIIDVVTGITTGNYVIDGSGFTGYFPIFSDRDTITTGNIYLSGANNIVFNAPPSYTTGVEEYLVLENNIIKRQTGVAASSYFTGDLIVSIASGKTFGKYLNGDTIPASGKTSKDVIEMAIRENLEVTTSLTSSTSVAFNQTAISNVLNFGYTINTLGATVSGASLEYRRGNVGAWSVLSTSTTNPDTYTHNLTDTNYNTSGFYYRYIVTDTAGSSGTSLLTITPSAYVAPTASLSIAGIGLNGYESNSKREKGHTNSTLGGTVTRNTSNVNLVSYQWQYQLNGAGSWVNIASPVSIGPGTTSITSSTHDDSLLNSASSLLYRVKIIDDYQSYLSSQVYSSSSTVNFVDLIFYGPTATGPTNSAVVRGLPSKIFVDGSNPFNLNTNTTERIFSVAMPNSLTVSEVLDLDALNANITANYLQSSFSVADYTGNLSTYNVYTMTNAIPYTSNHRHQITRV